MIDSHVHFWRLARGVNAALTPDMAAIYLDLEPAELRPILDRHEIAAAVVVQASETLGENLYMLGLARRFDWIAGVVGWLDPGSASLREEIDTLRLAPKLKGVRPVRYDNRSVAWKAEEGLAEGWAMLAQSGLTLDMLIQNWRELPLLEPLVARHPEARFVLDHCGKPDIAGHAFAEWASHISALARHANLFAKFSGLSQVPDVEAIRPFAEHMLASFGPERLLWASDWPPLELASSYDLWVEQTVTLVSELSAAERQALLHGTAARVYGLD